MALRTTLISLLFLSSTLASKPEQPPYATIDAGVVIGTTTSLPTATASVNQFLGIPFAKTPPKRFTPPQSPGKFKKPIQATKWSPACIQQFALDNISVESEDCLYLNVYAPSTPAPADGRAVLFWIYGGALQFGNAGLPDFDGSAFAAYEDVIVVSANYRMNVFGFPSSPAIPNGKHNLGFLDQRFALEWVQKNIHAFGGSPDKVTIFGESAGGWSVDALITSTPADVTPPFRGAIAQSGIVSYPGSFIPTDPDPSWTKLASALNCKGTDDKILNCVRAAPATKIKSIITNNVLLFYPKPDNITLVSDPSQRRKSGNIAHVPVLGGSTSQEGRTLAQALNNTTAFLQSTGVTTPEIIAAIEAAYPLAPGQTQYDQIAEIYTEAGYQCTAALWANDTVSVGIPAWRYYFNASFANTQRPGQPNLGVYHASDNPIVFSVYPTENVTTQEYAFSTFMRSTWARFAKNPAGGPGWNGVGTGAPGLVTVGDQTGFPGGVLTGASSDVVEGAWDLGVLGNRLDAMSSGVTVINEAEVDYRCAYFLPLYEAGFWWQRTNST